MSPTRLLWLCFFLCFLAALAHADGLPPVDPQMQVDDPTCDGCPTVMANAPFTFSSNATGGGTSVFTVGGDINFSTLDIETAGIFGSTTDVQCFSNAFGSCTVKFLDGVTDIFLSGCVNEVTCGIPVGRAFDIDLDTIAFDTAGNPLPLGCQFSASGCPAITPGVGDWGPNRSFTAIGGNGPDATTPFISAPEPSSILLLCSGAAGFVGLRKRMGSTRR